jgi:hypothetical protein
MFAIRKSVNQYSDCRCMAQNGTSAKKRNDLSHKIRMFSGFVRRVRAVVGTPLAAGNLSSRVSLDAPSN